MQAFDCVIIKLSLTAWDVEWMLVTWCYGPDYNYKWSDADYLRKEGLVVELKKGLMWIWMKTSNRGQKNRSDAWETLL